jgi:hypothetical protein
MFERLKLFCNKILWRVKEWILFLGQTLQLQIKTLVSAARMMERNRHLEDIHKYSPSQQDFGNKMAKKIEKNKRKTVIEHGNEHDTQRKSKPAKYQNTALVNRKHNYKQCVLCQSITINLPDHVKKVHDMNRNDPAYDKCVKEPPVIPKCYTQKKGTKTVLLEGDDLKAAKEMYEVDVVKQSGILESLKLHQRQISDKKKSNRKCWNRN